MLVYLRINYRLPLMIGVLFFVGLFIFTANANVYFWVDDNGKKHFSDKKPEGQTVEKKEYATRHEVDQQALQRQRDMKSFMTQQDAMKQQKQREVESESSAAQLEASQCKRIRQRLAHNNVVSVMYSLDENGERKLWTHEQRKTYKKTLEKKLKQYCKSS